MGVFQCLLDRLDSIVAALQRDERVSSFVTPFSGYVCLEVRINPKMIFQLSHPWCMGDRSDNGALLLP